MKTVNLHFAKTHLSSLVEEAAAGADVVIAKAGKPMVRLVSVASAEKPRTLGKLAGKIVEREDCWEPDAETEALFYQSRIEPVPVARVAEAPRKAKKK